jgi:hypothetical protein
MRRIKLVLAVAAAVVAMMAFAGPAFASTDVSCIHMPLSPMTAVAVPATFSALLLQLAVAVVIAVVAAVALAPTPPFDHLRRQMIRRWLPDF